MEVLVRLAAFAVGSAVVFLVISSAVRTVVVPGAERPLLTMAVVRPLHWLFRSIARRSRTDESRERVQSRFAPASLMLLPLVWAVGVIAGFVPIFWSLGVHGREAVIFSGSSLTTLGFSRPGEFPAVVLSFVEALLGLAIIALLISFLPTIYGQFSAREKAVARLEVRAGSPPDPVEMLTRMARIGVLDHMDEIWHEWEDWFIDLEESHTSHPSLVWFRSAVPGRSWITSAGAALDAAALAVSTLELENQWRAQLFIRTGYLSLRRVGDYWDLPYEPDPAPTDRISISKDEYDEVYEQMAAQRLPLKVDREQAWRDFAGWRVNYDAVLLGLCGLVEPPRARWSSDRASVVKVPFRLRATNRSFGRRPSPGG